MATSPLGFFVGNTSEAGCTLIDRERYVPPDWFDGPPLPGGRDSCHSYLCHETQLAQ